MTTLFPPAEAFRTHWLPVDGGHRLFVAEYGRPDGVPVLVLHGGPGSGGSPRLAGLFDPARFRVMVGEGFLAEAPDFPVAELAQEWIDKKFPRITDGKLYPECAINPGLIDRE